MLAGIRRNLWFLYYILKPFRLSLFVNHLLSRISSLITRSNGFRVIDLAIEYDCNLVCDHCSAKGFRRTEEKLNLEDYRNIVRDAGKLGNLSWNITGGEPLLVDWLDDLVEILDPARNYISIQTNCMLLSLERAIALKKLGVNCITTSLDSSVPEIHNKFRGNSKSYDKVFEGVRNARKAGMQVLIGGTATHENIRSAEFESLIQKVNSVGAMFLYNLAVPCGNWRNNKEIIITPEDRLYLLKLLEKYPASSTDHEPGRKKGCPAGMEKVYITPYGDVLPCPFIHVSFGNVKRQGLGEIVQKMRKVPQFGSYPDICVAAEDEDIHNEVFAKIYSHDDGRLPVPCEEVYRPGYFNE